MKMPNLHGLLSFGKVGMVKPLTSKEKKKREVKRKISNESRRKNRSKK